ncbi:MAG TPA: hypothetical protein VI094_20145 [Propionibacteriaceae bacterium]
MSSTVDPVLRFFADIDLRDIVITPPQGYNSAITTTSEEQDHQGRSQHSCDDSTEPQSIHG